MPNLVNGDLDPVRPFGSSAKRYLGVGWHPFWLPEKLKHPPEAGRTGWAGVDMTEAETEKVPVKRNIGIRMPVGVIGVDVDAYDGKKGGERLAELEAELGELPPAPRLSSRFDSTAETVDTVSGIRFFRVPEGTILEGDFGAGIEVVQRHHRYAVSAPSIHPKTGRPYRWMKADGVSEMPRIPRVDELPDLPKPWVDRFRATDSAGGGGMLANAGMVDVWLEGHRGWAPCEGLEKIVDEFINDEGSRHDAMVKAQMGIVNAATSGHQGGAKALGNLFEAFDDKLGGERDAEFEFMSALAGAVGRVMKDPPKKGGCCQLTNGRSLEVELTNDAAFGDKLLAAAGVYPSLTGLFAYGGAVVNLPRIGEEGYVPPTKGEDDGPAQIHALDHEGLRYYLHDRWFIYRLVETPFGLVKVHTYAPISSTKNVIKEVAREKTGLPRLSAVSHTPFIREDGTIVVEPGYDPASKIAYLPPAGLELGEVPAEPDVDDARAAMKYLVEFIADFPWVTERDRNNYLAAWLTPILLPRMHDTPPMIAVTAPMKGTGKTKLSDVLQETHGAVKRGPIPEGEELRKQITTILLQTTAPVVVWDNVVDPIGQPQLASLLTSPVWTDRVLGQNQETSLPAKRLWVANGNNVQLAGDMARRVVWSTIDADSPRPELRSFSFDPAVRARKERGDVLAALLTIGSAWVRRGAPMGGVARSDTFAEWHGTVGGVFEMLEMGETGNDPDREVEIAGGEDQELDQLLTAAWDVFGPDAFTAGEFSEACVGKTGGYSEIGEALPMDLHDKLREVGFVAGSMTRAIGRFLTRVDGRWTPSGYVVRRRRRSDDRTKYVYRLERSGGGVVMPPPAAVNGGDEVMPSPAETPIDASRYPVSTVSGGRVTYEDEESLTVGEKNESGSYKTRGEEREKRDNREASPAPIGERPNLDGMVAFDLETWSAERVYRVPPREDFIRCMSVSDGERHYLTYDHDEMRELLTGARWLVAHNAYGFDVAVAARHLGLDFDELIEKTFDTKVMSYLVFPPPSNNVDTRVRTPDISRHMDDLVNDLCGIGKTEPLVDVAARHWKALPKDERPESKDKFEAIDWTSDDAAAYAFRDGEVTHRLYEALRDRLPNQEYARREMRIGRITARMQYVGLGVDAEHVDERIAEDESVRQECRHRLRDRWGIETRAKLTKEGAIRAGEILTAAGVELETGALYRGTPVPKLNQEALEEIKDRVDDVGELARTILTLNGERGLPEIVKNAVCDDGRIHPSISMSQASGRWSVTKPGMTTFGKRTEHGKRDRKLIAARPGHVLYSEDYSTIDVRGMAALSQDSEMIARLQPGMDWHTAMAELVWGDPSRRKNAKGLSHAINYSAGPNTVSSSAGISYEEAERVIATINERFPKLAEFRRTVGLRSQAGEPIENGWGRRLTVDRERAVTQGPGLSGQGWARDAVMEGLLRLEERGLGRYVVMHVHDEYVFELPEDRAEELVRQIHEAMQFERDGVPVLSTPGSIGHNWYDTYEGE